MSAVFPDNIVFRNSEDDLDTLIAALQPGQPEAVRPGEVVVHREPNRVVLCSLTNNDEATPMVASLAILSDTEFEDYTTLADGSVFVYNSLEFRWLTRPGWGYDLSGSYLNDLGDVNATSPAVDGLLAWSGTEWVASSGGLGPLGGVVNIDLTNPPTGYQPLIFQGFDTKMWVGFLDKAGTTAQRPGEWYFAAPNESFHAQPADPMVIRFNVVDWYNRNRDADYSALVGQNTTVFLSSNLRDFESFAADVIAVEDGPGGDAGFRTVTLEIPGFTRAAWPLNPDAMEGAWMCIALNDPGEAWAPGSTFSLAMDDLTDVDLTTVAPTTNDLLKWDGSSWGPSVHTFSAVPTIRDYPKVNGLSGLIHGASARGLSYGQRTTFDEPWDYNRQVVPRSMSWFSNIDLSEAALHPDNATNNSGPRYDDGSGRDFMGLCPDGAFFFDTFVTEVDPGQSDEDGERGFGLRSGRKVLTGLNLGNYESRIYNEGDPITVELFWQPIKDNYLRTDENNEPVNNNIFAFNEYSLFDIYDSSRSTPESSFTSRFHVSVYPRAGGSYTGPEDSKVWRFHVQTGGGDFGGYLEIYHLPVSFGGHHIAVVREGATTPFKFFVDGVLQTPDTTVGDVNTTIPGLDQDQILRLAPDKGHCYIGEVAVWNYAKYSSNFVPRNDYLIADRTINPPVGIGTSLAVSDGGFLAAQRDNNWTKVVAKNELLSKEVDPAGGFPEGTMYHHQAPVYNSGSWLGQRPVFRSEEFIRAPEQADPFPETTMLWWQPGTQPTYLAYFFLQTRELLSTIYSAEANALTRWPNGIVNKVVDAPYPLQASERWHKMSAFEDGTKGWSRDNINESVAGVGARYVAGQKVRSPNNTFLSFRGFAWSQKIRISSALAARFDNDTPAGFKDYFREAIAGWDGQTIFIRYYPSSGEFRFELKFETSSNDLFFSTEVLPVSLIDVDTFFTVQLEEGSAYNLGKMWIHLGGKHLKIYSDDTLTLIGDSTDEAFYYFDGFATGELVEVMNSSLCYLGAFSFKSHPNAAFHLSTADMDPAWKPWTWTGNQDILPQPTDTAQFCSSQDGSKKYIFIPEGLTDAASGYQRVGDHRTFFDFIDTGFPVGNAPSANVSFRSTWAVGYDFDAWQPVRYTTSGYFYFEPTATSLISGTLEERYVDVTYTSGPDNLELLRWNGSIWEPAEKGPALNLLDGMVDVDYEAGINPGDYLVWDSSYFRPLPFTSDVAFDLDDIGDVNAPSPTLLQLLQYDGTEWINATVSTNTPELAAFTDTDIAGVTNGDILKYNGAVWVGGSYESKLILDDVGNVDETGKVVKEALAWDGANWVPTDVVGDINLDDLDDVDTFGKSTNQLLYWNDGAGTWASQSLGSVTNQFLTGLSDVNVLSASEGEALVWTGTEWHNTTSTTGMGDGGDLDTGVSVAPYAFNIYGGGDFEAGSDDLPVVTTIDGGDFD